MILNHKRLHNFVDYKHFKMESLQNVLELIRPWHSLISKMPFIQSYSQTPPILLDISCRMFKICMYTKLIWTSHANIYKSFKPSFSILREKGFLNVVYVDDSYLQGYDYEDCFSNALNTIESFRFLGLTIHLDKCKFIPTQHITYLGFILNSVQMTNTLTLEKKEKILNLWQEILSEDIVTIRFLLKLREFSSSLSCSDIGVILL